MAPRSRGNSTLQVLALVCGLVAVAFGGGWLLGTTKQPASDLNHRKPEAPPKAPARAEHVQAEPQPPKQAEAKPQPVQPVAPSAASDVRLASATANQPKPQVEPVPVIAEPTAQAEKPKVVPIPQPPKPDPEVNGNAQLPSRNGAAPPPIPNEEQAPAAAAKPVVPIGTLAQQKLARFEVSKPTPLQEVLRDLSELMAGRIELAENVSAEDLDQRVTVTVSDTTALAALEAALKSTSLRAAIQGDRIIISRE